MEGFAHRFGRWLAIAFILGGLAALGQGGLAAEPAAGDKPATEWKAPKPNAVTYFRGFMGIYRPSGQPSPFAFMFVPNGNLWTKDIQDKLRGHVPLERVTYLGTAQIAIPADGVYTLTLVNGKMLINGRDTDGSGELRMVKGIHRVEFASGNGGSGGNGIAKAAVSMKNKDTGEEVIFFNSWKDIQQFLKTPIQGQNVTDVSDWKPLEGDELKVDLKKFKVEKANP